MGQVAELYHLLNDSCLLKVTLVFATSQQQKGAAGSSCEIIAKIVIKNEIGLHLSPKVWNWKCEKILLSQLLADTSYFSPYIFGNVLFKMTWIFVVVICYQNNTWRFSSYLKFISIMYLTIAKLVMVGLNSVCFFPCLTIIVFFPPSYFSFFHLLYFLSDPIMHSLWL